jgi:3-oxo-5-alpha-steroid 4-dehydrogenase 1
MGFNIRSDNMLIWLRKNSSNGYRIPYGGLFKYISCPNHFSEIIEWTGYAIMVWNMPALSFAVWTFANLVPRALDHHKWYKSHFENYPKDRKAVFPGIL